MQFSYILSGWEGSAHDGTVLRDATFNHSFKTPTGRYWLGDAGYSNADNVLVAIGLYNWVRGIDGPNADILLEADTEDKRAKKATQPSLIYPKGEVTSKKMDGFRDQLAEQMWADYQRYINRIESDE
jgi:hypothetical protein